MNRKITVPLLVLVAALIILPTFTPEDAVTTLPIIGAIGVQGYALLCIGFIALLHVTGLLGKLARMVRLPPYVFGLVVAILLIILVVVET